MATLKASDYGAKPVKTLDKEKLVLSAVATFTNGTGTATVTGDPGIGLGDGGVGIFTLTYPALADAIVQVHVSVYSPADTITKCWLSAIDGTAGTATLNTAATAGTQADPASGDRLYILIVGAPFSK